MSAVDDHLEALDACVAARNEYYRYSSIATAWRHCQRPEWLAWYAVRRGYVDEVREVLLRSHRRLDTEVEYDIECSEQEIKNYDYFVELSKLADAAGEVDSLLRYNARVHTNPEKERAEQLRDIRELIPEMREIPGGL